MVRMQQVVAANLQLAPISDANKLPAGMSKKNKSAATKLKAMRVDPADHEKMLDEINRREVLEHDEVDDESSAEDSSDEDGEEAGSEGADE